MFLKLIDTVTGTMVTQMEFAGRRMEEIGLTGKVRVVRLCLVLQW